MSDQTPPPAETPGPAPYAAAPQPASAPYQPAPSINGLAIASFVLGLLGFALIPVIMGHVALGQIKRNGQGGAVFAIIGLVLGYLGIAVWVILLLVVFIPLIAVGAAGGFS